MSPSTRCLLSAFACASALILRRSPPRTRLLPTSAGIRLGYRGHPCAACTPMRPYGRYPPRNDGTCTARSLLILLAVDRLCLAQAVELLLVHSYTRLPAARIPVLPQRTLRCVQ